MKISIICFIFNLLYYIYFQLKSRYPIFSCPGIYVGMYVLLQIKSKLLYQNFRVIHQMKGNAFI